MSRISESQCQEIGRNRARARYEAWRLAHNDEMDVARQLQCAGLSRSEALREAARIVAKDSA